MAKTAVCTICSKNYLHFARTLMDSLARHQPSWDRHVLLVDRVDGYFEPAKENFSVIETETLPLPDMQRFFFRYTILELNTAVKPWLLERLLFQDEYERVIYLDPDICVYSPFVELESIFENGAGICLTPHLTGPLDNRTPTELHIMRTGTWNLGFIGLSQCDTTQNFLSWWQKKLEYDCISDITKGLFVDQKWCDLVPGMYAGVAILRHSGYNVAYWNLPHRHVEGQENSITVDELPLRFFHFSGIDPTTPHSFSKYQDRYTLDTLPTLVRDIVVDYSKTVLSNGANECRDWPYAYGNFDNGTPIIDSVRHYYRNSKKLQEALGTNPAVGSMAYFTEPIQTRVSKQALLSRVAHQVWLERPDVQKVYPDPFGKDGVGYTSWLTTVGATELRLPSQYIAPLNRAMSSPSSRTEFNGIYHMNPDEEALGLAWVGPELRVRIPHNCSGRFHLEGVYPARFLRAIGEKKCSLVATIDSTIFSRLELSDEGTFVLEGDVPQATGKTSWLTVSAGAYFIPAQLGARNDYRQLSYQLSSLRLGDITLIDSTGGDVDSFSFRERQSRIGVNVVGYFRAALGIGEGARITAYCMESSGIENTVVNFEAGRPNWGEDRSREYRFRSDNPYKVNLLQINADQMDIAVRYLGREFMDNHYNIGFWAWELPEFPERWCEAFEHVDEIWTPSIFCQQSIAAKAPCPVLCMPHAVEFTQTIELTRQDFGLPEDEFLFLVMYDANSIQMRKNPFSAISAFARAIAEKDSVTLVIKAMNIDEHPEDFRRLKTAIADCPGNVQLIDRVLERSEVISLQTLCDCYVSLHRSEGFGLCLAEAMYLGKPVIATNWSGNVDYMNHENSCLVDYELVPLTETYGPYEAGQIWAEPNIDHAAHYMRTLLDDADSTKLIGKKAAASIRKQLSFDAVGRLFRKRFDVIANML